VRDGDTLTVTYNVRNRTPNADPFYVEVFASVANGASCESIEEIATTTRSCGAAKGSFTVDVDGYVTFWVYTIGPGSDDYAMTDYAFCRKQRPPTLLTHR
jgi:hypothetical protein